jgi:hypothetical protein
MSPYEQNIVDFYQIYQDRPDLFTDEDRASLEALKTGFSEDDSVEKISDEIALWCEAHPHILDMLLEIPPDDTDVRGPGGRPTRLTSKEALELLENVVRNSKPDSDSDSDSPSSQPQKPPKP